MPMKQFETKQKEEDILQWTRTQAVHLSMCSSISATDPIMETSLNYINNTSNDDAVNSTFETRCLALKIIERGDFKEEINDSLLNSLISIASRDKTINVILAMKVIEMFFKKKLINLEKINKFIEVVCESSIRLLEIMEVKCDSDVTQTNDQLYFLVSFIKLTHSNNHQVASLLYHLEKKTIAFLSTTMKRKVDQALLNGIIYRLLIFITELSPENALISQIIQYLIINMNDESKDLCFNILSRISNMAEKNYTLVRNRYDIFLNSKFIDIRAFGIKCVLRMIRHKQGFVNLLVDLRVNIISSIKQIILKDYDKNNLVSLMESMSQTNKHYFIENIPDTSKMYFFRGNMQEIFYIFEKIYTYERIIDDNCFGMIILLLEEYTGISNSKNTLNFSISENSDKFCGRIQHTAEDFTLLEKFYVESFKVFSKPEYESYFERFYAIFKQLESRFVQYLIQRHVNILYNSTITCPKFTKLWEMWNFDDTICYVFVESMYMHIMKILTENRNTDDTILTSILKISEKNTNFEILTRNTRGSIDDQHYTNDFMSKGVSETYPRTNINNEKSFDQSMLNNSNIFIRNSMSMSVENCNFKNESSFYSDDNISNGGASRDEKYNQYIPEPIRLQRSEKLLQSINLKKREDSEALSKLKFLLNTCKLCPKKMENVLIKTPIFSELNHSFETIKILFDFVKKHYNVFINLHKIIYENIDVFFYNIKMQYTLELDEIFIHLALNTPVSTILLTPYLNHVFFFVNEALDRPNFKSSAITMLNSTIESMAKVNLYKYEGLLESISKKVLHISSTGGDISFGAIDFLARAPHFIKKFIHHPKKIKDSYNPKAKIYLSMGDLKISCDDFIRNATTVCRGEFIENVKPIVTHNSNLSTTFKRTYKPTECDTTIQNSKEIVKEFLLAAFGINAGGGLLSLRSDIDFNEIYKINKYIYDALMVLFIYGEVDVLTYIYKFVILNRKNVILHPVFELIFECICESFSLLTFDLIVFDCKATPDNLKSTSARLCQNIYNYTKDLETKTELFNIVVNRLSLLSYCRDYYKQKSAVFGFSFLVKIMSEHKDLLKSKFKTISRSLFICSTNNHLEHLNLMCEIFSTLIRVLYGDVNVIGKKNFTGDIGNFNLLDEFVNNVSSQNIGLRSLCCTMLKFYVDQLGVDVNLIMKDVYEKYFYRVGKNNPLEEKLFGEFCSNESKLGNTETQENEKELENGKTGGLETENTGVSETECKKELSVENKLGLKNNVGKLNSFLERKFGISRIKNENITEEFFNKNIEEIINSTFRKMKFLAGFRFDRAKELGNKIYGTDFGFGMNIINKETQVFLLECFLANPNEINKKMTSFILMNSGKESCKLVELKIKSRLCIMKTDSSDSFLLSTLDYIGANVDKLEKFSGEFIEECTNFLSPRMLLPITNVFTKSLIKKYINSLLHDPENICKNVKLCCTIVRLFSVPFSDELIYFSLDLMKKSQVEVLKGIVSILFYSNQLSDVLQFEFVEILLNYYGDVSDSFIRFFTKHYYCLNFIVRRIDNSNILRILCELVQSEFIRNFFAYKASDILKFACDNVSHIYNSAVFLAKIGYKFTDENVYYILSMYDPFFFPEYQIFLSKTHICTANLNIVYAKMPTIIFEKQTVERLILQQSQPNFNKLLPGTRYSLIRNYYFFLKTKPMVYIKEDFVFEHLITNKMVLPEFIRNADINFTFIEMSYNAFIDPHPSNIKSILLFNESPSRILGILSKIKFDPGRYSYDSILLEIFDINISYKVQLTVLFPFLISAPFLITTSVLPPIIDSIYRLFSTGLSKHRYLGSQLLLSATKYHNRNKQVIKLFHAYFIYCVVMDESDLLNIFPSFEMDVSELELTGFELNPKNISYCTCEMIKKNKCTPELIRNVIETGLFNFDRCFVKYLYEYFLECVVYILRQSVGIQFKDEDTKIPYKHKNGTEIFIDMSLVFKNPNLDVISYEILHYAFVNKIDLLKICSNFANLKQTFFVLGADAQVVLDDVKTSNSSVKNDIDPNSFLKIISKAFNYSKMSDGLFDLLTYYPYEKNIDFFAFLCSIMNTDESIIFEQMIFVIENLHMNFESILNYLDLSLETENFYNFIIYTFRSFNCEIIHSRLAPVLIRGLSSSIYYIREEFHCILDESLPVQISKRIEALFGMDWSNMSFYTMLWLLMGKNVVLTTGLFAHNEGESVVKVKRSKIIDIRNSQLINQTSIGNDVNAVENNNKGTNMNVNNDNNIRVKNMYYNINDDNYNTPECNMPCAQNPNSNSDNEAINIVTTVRVCESIVNDLKNIKRNALRNSILEMCFVHEKMAIKPIVEILRAYKEGVSISETTFKGFAINILNNKKHLVDFIGYLLEIFKFELLDLRALTRSYFYGLFELDQRNRGNIYRFIGEEKLYAALLNTSNKYLEDAISAYLIDDHTKSQNLLVDAFYSADCDTTNRLEEEFMNSLYIKNCMENSQFEEASEICASIGDKFNEAINILLSRGVCAEFLKLTDEFQPNSIEKIVLKFLNPRKNTVNKNTVKTNTFYTTETRTITSGTVPLAPTIKFKKLNSFKVASDLFKICTDSLKYPVFSQKYLSSFYFSQLLITLNQYNKDGRLVRLEPLKDSPLYLFSLFGAINDFIDGNSSYLYAKAAKLALIRSNFESVEFFKSKLENIMHLHNKFHKTCLEIEANLLINSTENLGIIFNEKSVLGAKKEFDWFDSNGTFKNTKTIEKQTTSGTADNIASDQSKKDSLNTIPSEISMDINNYERPYIIFNRKQIEKLLPIPYPLTFEATNRISRIKSLDLSNLSTEQKSQLYHYIARDNMDYYTPISINPKNSKCWFELARKIEQVTNDSFSAFSCYLMASIYSENCKFYFLSVVKLLTNPCPLMVRTFDYQLENINFSDLGQFIEYFLKNINNTCFVTSIKKMGIVMPLTTLRYVLLFVDKHYALDSRLARSLNESNAMLHMESVNSQFKNSDPLDLNNSKVLDLKEIDHDAETFDSDSFLFDYNAREFKNDIEFLNKIEINDAGTNSNNVKAPSKKGYIERNNKIIELLDSMRKIIASKNFCFGMGLYALRSVFTEKLADSSELGVLALLDRVFRTICKLFSKFDSVLKLTKNHKMGFDSRFVDVSKSDLDNFEGIHGFEINECKNNIKNGSKNVSEGLSDIERFLEYKKIENYIRVFFKCFKSRLYYIANKFTWGDKLTSGIIRDFNECKSAVDYLICAFKWCSLIGDFVRNKFSPPRAYFDLLQFEMPIFGEDDSHHVLLDHICPINAFYVVGGSYVRCITSVGTDGRDYVFLFPNCKFEKWIYHDRVVALSKLISSESLQENFSLRSSFLFSLSVVLYRVDSPVFLIASLIEDGISDARKCTKTIILEFLKTLNSFGWSVNDVDKLNGMYKNYFIDRSKYDYDTEGYDRVGAAVIDFNFYENFAATHSSGYENDKNDVLKVKREPDLKDECGYNVSIDKWDNGVNIKGCAGVKAKSTNEDEIYIDNDGFFDTNHRQENELVIIVEEDDESLEREAARLNTVTKDSILLQENKIEDAEREEIVNFKFLNEEPFFRARKKTFVEMNTRFGSEILLSRAKKIYDNPYELFLFKSKSARSYGFLSALFYGLKIAHPRPTKIGVKLFCANFMTIDLVPFHSQNEHLHLTPNLAKMFGTEFIDGVFVPAIHSCCSDVSKSEFFQDYMDVFFKNLSSASDEAKNRFEFLSDNVGSVVSKSMDPELLSRVDLIMMTWI